MSVDVKYTAHATATGGRDGKASVDDGSMEVKLTVPKEMGGPGGPGANPEQLFAMGYAACFIGALKAVSAGQPVKAPNDTSIKASVGIGPRSEGGFGLTVALAVTMPGLAKADAEALVAKAHQVCPYSNATRNNVDVKLSVV